MAMGLIYCDPIIINFILQNVRSDITNIFESKNFNVQKISQLSKEGYIIKKQVPSIYYVNGLLVPTQIVVTNQLNSQNHESLKVLSKSAQTDDIQRFTELASAFTEPGDKEKADAVLQVSVAANRKKYDEVRRTSDMCEALRELMKEEIEEELKKNREQAIQQGLEQGRINQLIDLVKQNLLSIETAAQCAKMTVNEFQIVLKKTKQLTIANRDGNAALQCRIFPSPVAAFLFTFFTVPLLLLLRSLR